jgi:ribosomal protein L37AE/L43A
MSESADSRQQAAGSARASNTEEVGPSQSRLARRSCKAADAAMICERCGKAEMYRMHAVWRCPDCGFKTDCCGW